MAQTLIDPPQLNNLIGHNYELLLNKSIDALLNSQTGDTSSHLNTLYQLIQSRVDPPLESIWVYSALSFSDIKSPKDKFSDRVSGLKELFELISMLSASRASSKSIVLLAPVIYEVHRVIVDMKSMIGELDSKKEQKLMKKIKSLVKSILGFISVCCAGNGDEPDSGLGSDEFIKPLEDLIRVWIGSKNCEGLEKHEIFKLFFPILGYELVGVGVSELVGSVIAEALLVRLCLDLGSGVSEQELRAQAVGSITGFRTLYFFETLLRMLLEQSLPVTSLLSSENEVSLRKVLFDAVILPGYSFLNPEIMIHVSVQHVLSLSILQVLVTHEAAELFRKNGDHTKSLSYLEAFNSSRLPSQLVKMVSDKVSTRTEADQPKGMSPKAILKWLHNLEDQRMIELGDSILNFRSRLMFDKIEAENVIPKHSLGGKHLDPDFVFYIDNKGKIEDEHEMANNSINASAPTLVENRRDKKRKKRKSVEKKRGIKFQKHEIFDDSGKNASSLRNNELNSESEVENPLSNDDVESE